jgi:hypothetical protein
MLSQYVIANLLLLLLLLLCCLQVRPAACERLPKPARLDA